MKKEDKEKFTIIFTLITLIMATSALLYFTQDFTKPIEPTFTVEPAQEAPAPQQQSGNEPEPEIELKTNLPSESGPYKVIAADFTGDGIVDLVLAYRYIGIVTIEQGDGKGNFALLAVNQVCENCDPSYKGGIYNITQVAGFSNCMSWSIYCIS